jgi:hypothetical protein
MAHAPSTTLAPLICMMTTECRWRKSQCASQRSVAANGRGEGLRVYGRSNKI